MADFKIGKFPGTDIKSLKQHPALIPLIAIIGAGGVLAGWYTFRLATKNPDVTWSRMPYGVTQNDRYKDKSYKLVDNHDYKNIGCPAPDYMKDAILEEE